MDSRTIVKGTVILTISGIAVKIMGFVYRIYMTRLIGAEGMGLYQLIMPFYMLAFSLTSAGLTTAVSKVTSAEMGKKRIKSGFMCAVYASLIGASMALAIGIFGFFGSDIIGGVIMGEPSTEIAIKILSLSFPFMAVSSCMRGVFYGMGKTEIPAASQIIEQSTKIAVVFLIGSEFVEKGIEYACAAAAVGMSVGEIVSFLFVAVIYFINSRKVRDERCLKGTGIIKMLIYAAIPLTANRTASSLLSGLENMLIPRQLISYGMSETQALEAFGRISGMVMPLVMFPSAFLMAMASSVMPVVSEKWACGNKNAVKRISEKTVSTAVIIGVFAAYLFFTFPGELGYIIYSDRTLGFYIKLTALMCPLIYIQSAFAAVLNGLSEQRFIFRNGLISSGIMIGFIYFFMPYFEINAFFAGWLVSLGISSFMCISRIQQRAEVCINVRDIIGGLAKGFIAFMPVRIMFDRINMLMDFRLALLICVSTSIIIYGALNFDYFTNK